MDQSAEPLIDFRNISKTYGDFVAVDKLNLQIYPGEFITVLGSSGSGKTTMLRMINKLETPDANPDATICFAGQNIAEVDPVAHRRRIGYVVQSIALFPHQTIAQNIATVPNLLGWKQDKIAARVAQLLALIGLEPSYAERYPDQLSGGQRQRVGVARALAADPPVMLLDEPFGAVDPITRLHLQEQIANIHQSLNQAGQAKTFILVTHDIHEALTLGTRVLIMDQGKIEQFAPPAEIMAKPASEFVAKLLATLGPLNLPQANSASHQGS